LLLFASIACKLNDDDDDEMGSLESRHVLELGRVKLLSAAGSAAVLFNGIKENPVLVLLTVIRERHHHITRHYPLALLPSLTHLA